MKKIRKIDKAIKDSFFYFNNLNLVSRIFLRKLRLLLVLLFIIGFITAVIWMISDKYFYWR